MSHRCLVPRGRHRYHPGRAARPCFPGQAVVRVKARKRDPADIEESVNETCKRTYFAHIVPEKVGVEKRDKMELYRKGEYCIIGVAGQRLLLMLEV